MITEDEQHCRLVLVKAGAYKTKKIEDMCSTGHLHPKLELPRLTCLAACYRTQASTVGGVYPSKELFKQRINSYIFRTSTYEHSTWLPPVHGCMNIGHT